jgi:hypothetical protein
MDVAWDQVQWWVGRLWAVALPVGLVLGVVWLIVLRLRRGPRSDRPRLGDEGRIHAAAAELAELQDVEPASRLASDRPLPWQEPGR